MGKKEGKPFKIENIKLTSLTVIHKLVSLIAMPNSRNIKKNETSVCMSQYVFLSLDNIAEVNL